MTRRHRLALIFAASGVAGLVVLSGAVVALLRDRTSAADFGTRPSSPQAAARPVAVVAAGTAATSQAPSPTAVPAPARHAAPGPPVRIRIPTLHVDAPVIRVAVTGGSLGVPADPATVGWWTKSARPGSRAGAVVFDGHVDSATRGLGAFFQLTTLQPHDLITVTTARGAQIGYRVTARHTYLKSAGLPAGVFVAPGPQLVLITCGGPFDTNALSYEDNIVVVAMPATTAWTSTDN